MIAATHVVAVPIYAVVIGVGWAGPDSQDLRWIEGLGNRFDLRTRSRV